MKAVISSPGASVVSTCGVVPGGRCSSANGNRARAARAANFDLRVERDQRLARNRRDIWRCSRSLMPSTAWLRLTPSSAAQPEPGVRLLQSVQLRVAEIGAARALEHIAAERRHVADLRAGGELQALRDDGIIRLHVRDGRRLATSAPARRAAGPASPDSIVPLLDCKALIRRLGPAAARRASSGRAASCRRRGTAPAPRLRGRCCGPVAAIGADCGIDVIGAGDTGTGASSGLLHLRFRPA